MPAWRQVLAQFRAFLAGTGGAGRIPGHINVTGGEPFALPEFPELLEEFSRHPAEFAFAVLSNGTLIDGDWARRLKPLGVRYVQVSLDGMEAGHDRIRGGGNFRRAVAGIKELVKAGVPAVIAFTAQRENFREFPEIARLGVELGATRVWADRLIPEGQGSASSCLSREETREFFSLMQAARQAVQHLHFIPRHRKTDIALHRALQFLAGGDSAYQCTAGDSLLTVMPDGRVYPCRRLPIAVGNVFHQSLAEIYQQAILCELRNPAVVHEGCEDCVYAAICRGGLRCLAYARTGSLRMADPGCWLASTAPAAAPATAAAAV